MTANNRILVKIDYILDFYKAFPGIEVHHSIDNPLSGEMIVKNHPPLTKIKYHYIKKQHLISSNYDLCLSIYSSAVVTTTKIHLRDAISRDRKKLNNIFGRNLLSSPAIKLIQDANEWDIIIVPDSKGTRIELYPYIGNITQTTIPPVVSVIKPTYIEVLHQLEVLQIIKSCFQ